MYSEANDAALHWSLDELRARQLDRLQDTARRVYAAVPHYRKAFDEVGVHPDDVRSLEDIARLPFTDKHTLRDNYPFGMFAVPREEVVRITPVAARPGRRPWWATPKRTWTCGPTWSRGACGWRGPGRVTCSTTWVGMGCSPAAWGCMPARSGCGCASSPSRGA